MIKFSDIKNRLHLKIDDTKVMPFEKRGIDLDQEMKYYSALDSSFLTLLNASGVTPR
jgi:hypothetical protein